MGRVYGEPAQVRTGADGRPAWFAWRARRYTVRSVIGHWVASREWWSEPEPGMAQPELEFWRVEATADRDSPPGAYELRHDVASGAWVLRGVAD
jgi:hypothetical protein